MTGQQGRLGTAFADEVADVGGQFVDVVGRDAVRLRRQVIAAHIRCNYPESRRRERFDLLPPPVPELGEAVQQDNQRPVTSLDVVQSLVAYIGIAFAKFPPSGHDPSPPVEPASPLK